MVEGQVDQAAGLLKVRYTGHVKAEDMLRGGEELSVKFDAGML